MSARRLSLALMAAMLAGCSDGDIAEVNQWMAKTRAETKVQVTPISEPKTFIPFGYAAQDDVDPFEPNKLLGELARTADQSNNLFKPDMSRKKEFLEGFPLDSFRMVGTLQKNGSTYGLLQTDRGVYQITRGARLGQNYGIVTALSESEISIKETVQDAAGEWVERITKLELQESKESNK